MLPRPAVSFSIQRLLSGAAAAAVCGVGVYWFGKTVDVHYAVREWLIWRLLAVGGYALLFNASCVAFGAFLLRRLLAERQLPALERLLQSMMLGLTAFALCLYGFGFVGLLKPWAAVSIPLVFLAAGQRDARRLVAELVAWRATLPAPRLPERVLGTLAALGGSAALVFMYLEALDVSVINFDASWYHFPVGQDYARLGRVVPLPGEGHKAFPHLTSMIHAWALLVPELEPLPLRWMLSLHLEFTIVVWRVVAAATLARWLLGGRDVRGLWAGFFLFPSIFIYDQAIGGGADHYLGFFAVPVLLALARALPRFDVRWCVLFGVALGGHLLVKYQAIYLLVAASVIIALRVAFLLLRLLLDRARLTAAAELPSVPALLRGVGAIAFTVIVISAPHYVKNTVFYKNPVYPYAQSVFTASWPKSKPGYYQLASSKASVFALKGDGLTRQVNALRKVFDYSFKTSNRSLTSKRPYMGALFSLLLPCALLVPRRRRTFFAIGATVLAFLVWANTVANDRYLLAFYDWCIGIALALMVRVWDLGAVARAGLVPLVALQLFWGGDAMLYYGKKELLAALDLIGQGYSGKGDAARFDQQKAQRRITADTPEDAVILARNYKGLLGLNRMVLSDIQPTQHYIDYSFLEDPREFYDHLKERGVTHLLYPHGLRRPDAWNNVILFGELFRAGEDRRTYGRLRLARLSPTPPARSTPYMVLVSGVREYPDGIYQLEQLDVSYRTPSVSPKPKPKRRLTGSRVELPADVRAVVVGSGKLPKNLAEDALDDFQSQETLDGFEYYLRRAKQR